MTLRNPGGYVAVIDTKWKALSSDAPVRSVSEADVYQMLAYMTRYECATGMLLYPAASAVGRQGVISRVDLAGKRLVLAGIDLSEIGRVPERLESLLRATILQGVGLEEAA
jgi:5-methylcytosine-specific restriction enzyme subunit McrC